MGLRSGVVLGRVLVTDYTRNPPVSVKISNVQREEIEQKVRVWHRNYNLLDISKVLLKMYSKGYLFFAVLFMTGEIPKCPARDPWFAGHFARFLMMSS